MDVLRILGGVASLVAIITACVKVVQWLRTPAHKLEVRVAWNSFRLPPKVQSEFTDQWNGIAAAFEQTEREISEKREKDATRVVNDLLWNVRHGFQKQPSFELRTLRGFWAAIVVNSGKKKCTGVDLRLPNATEASVKHDREATASATAVNEVIHLGELRPGGECEVLAWTDRSLTNDDYRAVRVSHDSGVGKVRGEWRNDRFAYLVGTVLKNAVPAIVFGAIWFTAIETIPTLIKALTREQERPATPLNISYDDFKRGFRELDGRDREQEDYVERSAGKEVTWDVAFERASTSDKSVFVSFGNDGTNSPVQSGSIAIAERDRVFALHRGDAVRIRGRLKKMSSRALHVDIAELQLLKPNPTPSIPASSPIPSP